MQRAREGHAEGEPVCADNSICAGNNAHHLQADPGSPPTPMERQEQQVQCLGCGLIWSGDGPCRGMEDHCGQTVPYVPGPLAVTPLQYVLQAKRLSQASHAGSSSGGSDLYSMGSSVIRQNRGSPSQAGTSSGGSDLYSVGSSVIRQNRFNRGSPSQAGTSSGGSDRCSVGSSVIRQNRGRSSPVSAEPSGWPDKPSSPPLGSMLDLRRHQLVPNKNLLAELELGAPPAKLDDMNEDELVEEAELVARMASSEAAKADVPATCATHGATYWDVEPLVAADQEEFRCAAPPARRGTSAPSDEDSESEDEEVPERVRSDSEYEDEVGSCKGNSGVPLREVPYAAENLVVPPGGESHVAGMDQQLQVAEQLQEPGAHQMLVCAFPKARTPQHLGTPKMPIKLEETGCSSTVKGPKGRSRPCGAETSADPVSTYLEKCDAFRCSCEHAGRLGTSSCLEPLNKLDLRRLHAATYGLTGVLGAAELPRTERRRRILEAYHRLPREKLQTDGGCKGTAGKCWRVTRWQVVDRHNVPVCLCHRGWVCAIGGSPNAHAEMYALLLRGHSPADFEGKTLASKQKHLLQLAESAGNRRRNKCRDYAVNFWLNLMRLQDYMPNDNKLVLRGPGYGFLHEHVYKPPALKAGMYFSYKRWMSCVPEGLRLVGVELKEKHGDMDADKLRFGRCEKHSKFSECTKCQTTREEYLQALGNPEASPEFVKEKLDALLEHRSEWVEVCCAATHSCCQTPTPDRGLPSTPQDRGQAINIRQACFTKGTNTLYECDDKCGSWWQCLPVPKNGR